MGTQGFKPEKRQSCELETLPHHRLPRCSVSTQVQSRGPTQGTLTRHSVRGPAQVDLGEGRGCKHMRTFALSQRKRDWRASLL